MNNFMTTALKDFEVTETVGGFRAASTVNTFDDIYTEAYNNLKVANVDLMSDLNQFIKNKAKIAAFKENLLGNLALESEQMKEDPEAYGTHACLYNQVSDMFDNCVADFVKESAANGTLLPIKALDFPILVKQHLKLATKDIMQTEVTKSPIIKKHIEQTYIVDKKSGKKWKYPQCFFTDEFKEVYAAGKGLPIKPTKVTLPALDFDVVANCTDGVSGQDEFTIDLKIEKVYVGDTAIVLDQPMRINLSDNTWLGGKVDKTITSSTGAPVEVHDIVTGFVDFAAKTTTLGSVAGQITAVEFSGFLSNQRNERSVTFEYAREEREWKIEDGMRADAPFMLEDLEDAKALLDIDLYKKTYNNLTDLLTQMEDSQVLAWLDEQFVKYQGVEVDPLSWGSFITERKFDCDSSTLTTALPSEYIEKQFKFLLDRVLIDIADKAKLDDLTFVVYGNPRYISLLNSVVNWVTRPGSTQSGVKLDYGYGIMTSGDIKVQVVSTKKVNATYDESAKEYNGIRIIPFPLSQELFTFKHYKYTTHILTSQNSAYRAADLPGGSHTYIVGVSRYTNAAVQGIQGQVKLVNAENYITVK